MKNRKIAVGSAVAGVSVLSLEAGAALPTYASDLFTTLQGYGTDVLAATTALMAIVFGGFWLISLVKKGANKGK